MTPHLVGIIGYAVVIAVCLLLTFWVVRAAILSALAADRRRRAQEKIDFEHEVERQERLLGQKAAKKRSGEG